MITPLPRMLALGVLAICAASAGCSLISTNRVPDDYELSQDLDCSGPLPPSVDLILGAGLAGFGGYVLGTGLGDDDGLTGSFGGNLGLGTAAALSGVTLLGSAIAGFIWNHRCHRAEAWHESWNLEPSDEGKRELERRFRAGESPPED